MSTPPHTIRCAPKRHALTCLLHPLTLTLTPGKNVGQIRKAFEDCGCKAVFIPVAKAAAAGFAAIGVAQSASPTDATAVVSQLVVTGDRDDVATAIGEFQSCLQNVSRAKMTVCWPQDGGKVLKWLHINRSNSAVSKSVFASLDQILKQAKASGVHIGRRPGKVTGRVPFVTIHAQQQAAQTFKVAVE